MHVLNVVGARPNMMKIAPLSKEMGRHNDLQETLLHTGQHYDANMSQIFFDELSIPQPDIYLGIGSGSHAEQTGKIMVEFEKVLAAQKPDIVLVVGDVNSTLACSIVAAKMTVPVVHVEAGLRSFDRTMPEEINRIVTDALSDLLFTTSHNANENLIREGISEEKIFFVGNLMIDTLKTHLPKAKSLETPKSFGLESGNYALLTVHRASNVDDPAVLQQIIDALVSIHQDIPIVFPAHPRTVKRISDFGFQSRLDAMPNFKIVPPQGYLAFLDLMAHAKLVLTDSGGVQEETTILNVPCLTLRNNTERPVTVTDGTNIMVGLDTDRIVSTTRQILAGESTPGQGPELWDGHTAQRIVKILQQQMN